MQVLITPLTPLPPSLPPSLLPLPHTGIPLLTDVPARLAFMDTHKIEMHVLVPLPWLEVVPACHTNKEK
jgi:hypothetical protein